MKRQLPYISFYYYLYIFYVLSGMYQWGKGTLVIGKRGVVW